MSNASRTVNGADPAFAREQQSPEEKLTVINAQLQASLERQRTVADDLQNVLNSTHVATIFLDTKFRIRLFTPTTRALFNVTPNDIGRKLADLDSLAFDAALLNDAHAVLRLHNPIEREIESHAGNWFVRRVLPYRTSDNAIEGIVITFVDATERKRITDALNLAKRQAEMANVAKSRFVAAASHDLRQPLQTLALLQGLLANIDSGTKVRTLVTRLGDTLGAMSGMLNTLLDLNQIEAGTLRAEPVTFPINDLLVRLRDEFTYLAQAQGLLLRMVPCRLAVHSDPRLLEQMIRNLLSNAVKYTRHGKVLIGCRRRGAHLAIEVWDTGIGMPAQELGAIFEEYHQVDNTARERSRGLGLGLSIVQQLGNLLCHTVNVRSRLGHGSVFSIEVPMQAGAPVQNSAPAAPVPTQASVAVNPDAGTVLVIEDDPDLRDLLEIMIREEGHTVMTAPDGLSALDMVARGAVRPDLVLTDYNLPNGMDGLQVAAGLRRALGRRIGVIVLTGDTTTTTLRAIAGEDCVHMHKPAKMQHLTRMIQRLLLQAASAPAPTVVLDAGATAPTVFVVDDDRMVRETIRATLQEHGVTVEDFGSAEAFLASYRPGTNECLLLDIYLPVMSGIELVHHLRRSGHGLPVVMITGKGDISVAVHAMKAGAVDFVEKPVSPAHLLESLTRALAAGRDAKTMRASRDTAAQQLAGLTPRQREIMEMVLAGHPSKNIAADLGLSQRTVENHRASIMRRTKAKSLPALARLALAAAGTDPATESGGPPAPKPASRSRPASDTKPR